MALEDITTTLSGEGKVVELLSSAIVVNGIPSTSTDGISTNSLHINGKRPSKIRVSVHSTAGAGAMTATMRLWLRAAGIWFVAKPLAASRSAPQTAVAIAETTADAISYSENVKGIDGADRLYLEIISIGGSAAAKADLALATLAAGRLNTVIRAKTAGTAGNSITIAAVADGAGVGSLTLVGTAYTFHFANGVTTVTNFQTLITASALLEVETTGTGATVLASATDTFTAHALAGGIDAEAITGYAIVSI